MQMKDNSVEFSVQDSGHDGSVASAGKSKRKAAMDTRKVFRSVILTPEKKAMMALIRIYIFFEGCCNNGWNHVNNVYYVVFLSWSPFKASWVWFTRDIVRMATLAPAGSYIDKTKHKKKILVAIGIQKIFGGIIMTTTDNYVAHVIKGATDGLAEAFVAPTVAAMMLGVVGKTRFHKKALAYNVITKNCGFLLAIFIFGCVAFSIYPNVSGIFYQYIIVGVFLLVVVGVMPPESMDVVDHRRAAGKSFIARSTIIQNIGWDDVHDSDDDDNNDDDDVNQTIEMIDQASKKETKNPMNELTDDEHVSTDIPTEEGSRISNNIAANSNLTATESQTFYTKTLTLREMYSDPTRGRSLIFLSLVLGTIHLVNATILPLTGQFLGISTNDRYSMSVFMIFMLIKLVADIFSSWYLVGRLEDIGYRKAMAIATVLLGLHCALFATVSAFTDKIWVLAIVQAVQGPPMAIVNIVTPLYVHLLSRRTGRFNFNYGVIDTFKVVGSAISIIGGGALATVVSYQVVFIVLSALSVVPFALTFGVVDLNLSNSV